MAKTQELKFIMTADGKRAVTQFNSVSGAMKKMSSHLPSMRTMILGATAAIGGLSAGIFALTKSTASAYDRVQKFSDQLGISTQFISKMQVAAEFSGMEIKTMEKSIQKMTISVAEAGRGLATYKDAFDDLGISVFDNQGKRKETENVFLELTDAFSKLEDKTLKADVAYRIFGARGLQMLQIMKDGKEGVKAMWKEAERFGLVVSEKAGKNAAEFNDSLTRLTGSFKGVKNKIAEDLLEPMTNFFNRLAYYIADNRTEIVAFAKDFINSLASIAEGLAISGGTIIDWLRDASAGWREVKIAMLEGKFDKLFADYEKNAASWSEETRKARQEIIFELGQELQVLRELQVAYQLDPGIVQKLKKLGEGIKQTTVEISKSGKAFGDTGGAAAGLGSEIETLSKKWKTMLDRLKFSPWELFLKKAEEAKQKLKDRPEDLAIIDEVILRKQLNAVEKFSNDFVKETWGAYDKVEKKAEDLGKTTEDVFASMRHGADNTANALVYSFETMFFDDFKDGLDSLLDYFKRFLVRLASTALAQRISIPVNTVLMGASGLFPSFEAPAAGTGLSGWLSGLGGLAAGAGGYLIGDQFGGYGKWGGAAGGLGGYALSSGLGSFIGMSGGVGTALGFGGGSALGSAFGSILGSAFGSIIPVIGTIAGGLLGGWLGGLFGKKRIPSTELYYRPAEDSSAGGYFQIKGEDKVGSRFTNATIKAMDLTRDNLLNFMESIGGDTSKFFEKFASGSKNLDKKVDLKKLFDKWSVQYSEFVTGINFEDFQRKGEKLTATIDRITGAVINITSVKDIDIQKLYDDIKVAPDTLKESLESITEDIYDAADDLEGLSGVDYGDKISEINDLLIDGYNEQIKYLTYIKGLTGSMSKSIKEQIEGFELSTMTPKEKIKHYRDNLKDLWADLQEATDPVEIKRIVDNIQKDLGKGWNVLTAAEKAKYLDQATDFLKDVNDISQRKLDDAVTEQVDTVAELADRLAEIDWSPLGHLTTAAEDAADALDSLASPTIPKYEHGTPYVPQTGLAYVHKGEQIIPAGQNAGGGQPITIILEGDAGSIITSAKVAATNETIRIIRRNPRVLN